MTLTLRSHQLLKMRLGRQEGLEGWTAALQLLFPSIPAQGTNIVIHQGCGEASLDSIKHTQK